MEDIDQIEKLWKLIEWTDDALFDLCTAPTYDCDGWIELAKEFHIKRNELEREVNFN